MATTSQTFIFNVFSLNFNHFENIDISREVS